MQTCRERRKFSLTKIIDDIHKLIVQELKLNVNCQIKKR
jgi:hypothetical protein